MSSNIHDSEVDFSVKELSIQHHFGASCSTAGWTEVQQELLQSYRAAMKKQCEEKQGRQTSDVKLLWWILRYNKAKNVAKVTAPVESTPKLPLCLCIPDF